MNKASSFSIRPLNPDNESEIHHLISLFERCEGQGITSSAVYAPKFWKNSVIKKFVALITIFQGRIVAHGALGCDRNSAGVGVLSNLVFDPAALEILPEVAAGYSDLIASQAQRKGLTSIITFRDVESSSVLERFLEEAGIMPIAVLQDEISSIEIGAKLFSSRARSLHYLPIELRDEIAKIYSSLGTSCAVSPNVGSTGGSLAADDMAVERLPLPRAGRTFAFITPSLVLAGAPTLRLPPRLQTILSRWPSAVMCLKLSDHGCTQLIEVLRTHRFNCAGILPGVRGRDSIIFTRDGLSFDARLDSNDGIARPGSIARD